MTDLIDIDKLIEPSIKNNSSISIDKLEDVRDVFKESYNSLVCQIESHFEVLKNSLESRKNILLKELKYEFENNQSLSNDQMNISDDKIYEFNLNQYDELDIKIKNYGKIQRKKQLKKSNVNKLPLKQNPVNFNLVDCYLTGKGLRECYKNRVATFTITFKNGAFSKSNMSFLDIFIVAKSDFSNKASVDSSNEIRQVISSIESTNSECNCDCKLEFINDGIYAINYKLDKPGLYLLNILVNKQHVGESPYKLKCCENQIDKKVKHSELIKSMSSYKVSPLSSSIKLVPSHTQLRHSITNENIRKFSSETERKTKKHVESNSITQLTNISNTSSAKNSKISSPTFSNCSSKSKPFSFKNGVNISMTKSSSSIGIANIKDKSLINLRTTSSLNETKNTFMTFQSNSESLAVNNKDDYLFQMGTRGRNCAEFLNPQAVCATADYIYISDSNNQKIDVFTHSGEYKFNLGNSLTITNRIIRRPIGIESTCDKKILVVDYEYKCVNVFDENGKYLNKICQKILLGPKDAKANSVCIFDSEGKFLSRFGNLGNKNENFAGPQYVACLSNADIAVTDFYNHCIKIFDYLGNFRFSFGSNGIGHGQFNGPTGIAVDKLDNIIVADWGNSRIQVFDKHGRFVRYVICETNRLYGPQDLTLINKTMENDNLNCELIAVADSGNHCVKIFKYK